MDKTPANLKQIGMVRDAAWLDVNKDNIKDLVVVGEWMPVTVYINKNGVLEKDNAWSVTNSAGWWNTMAVEDYDNDGDMDLIVGNLGLNTQLKASADKPASLYFKDFAGNDVINPVLCYYIGDKSYPAASRDDLLEQMVFLKKKYNNYASYSTATINDIFTKEQLSDAGVLKAEQLASCYFENTGGGFKMTPLSMEAQIAPIYAIAVSDINNDGKKDILSFGNNSYSRIKYGRYDANHGQTFMGNGKGQFDYITSPISGLQIKGNVRSAVTVKDKILVGLNSGRVVTLNY